MQRPVGLVLAASILVACPPGVSAQTTERLYLSGTDKDHTVPWEFTVTGGRGAGVWSTIPVPSNWELGVRAKRALRFAVVRASRVLPSPRRGSPARCGRANIGQAAVLPATVPPRAPRRPR
jgi:hypothetical protein